MKRYLFAAVLALSVALAGSVQAQSALTPAIDTLTNVDTLRVSVRAAGIKDMAAIQLNYTKISGTSASSVTLQASLDGVNYATVKGADTATITNVAGVQTFLWKIVPSPYLWYRLYGVTSGTQSGQVKALYLGK